MGEIVVAIFVVIGIVVVAGIIDQANRAADRTKPKACTVLVCGATGVGKSTLINAVAKRPATQVGIGAPVTQNTTRIDVPEIGFSFYDSKGLEVLEASETYLLLLSDLLRLRYLSGHFLQVDVVLICIAEPIARFDDAHEEIAGLCSDLQIPYGIALTKAEGNEGFREEVASAFPGARFIRPVRALPMKVGGAVIPAEGLEGLVEALRKHQDWNSDAARQRRAFSSATGALAASAQSLAASQTDLAWQRFAQNAYEVMLRPGKNDPQWQGLTETLRDRVRKNLVPDFFDRVLFKKFDNSKIDGALARRLVPAIVRTFTGGRRVLGDLEAGDAVSEATQLMESDRPYRSRF